MSDRAQLLDMGFSAAKIDKALKVTKNAGLQPAMDWILAHIDDPDDAMDVDDAADETPAESSTPAEAKSLKCTDCGKQFKNEALANYHAEKSGHSNFEESTDEIKPLTEEEKKERLAELKAKMEEKRKLKAKQDAAEAKANEAIRRKGGKEIGQIKEEMKLKEAEKEAAQRKQDKINDAKARAKVKADIEEDKRRRAEKAAAEKAAREGKPAPAPTTATGPSTVTTSVSSKSDTTRLQIRLPDGSQPLICTRSSSDSLKDVLAWVISQKSSISSTSSFSTPFPRKKFEASEMNKSLADLGLVPSSVLLLS